MAKVNPITTSLAIPAVPAATEDDDEEEDDGCSAHKPAERGSIVGVAVGGWRRFLHNSGWHDSRLAKGTRTLIRGQAFTAVAMVCLFLALFLSDLFIMCGVETDFALDLILTMVLLIFAFEFIGLTLTDPSYVFSFFFWMDLLGTASMIFDVTFLLARSATEPEKYMGSGAEENIIVVRAARATKLGARAGRLARVMKLLRHLPFIRGDEQDSDVKMASRISNQLTNVLSTRVAFLTICIVVVLPIFGMFTYPEVDDSMATWTELLYVNTHEISVLLQQTVPNVTEIQLARTRLDRELNAYAGFYANFAYGPFWACFGTYVMPGDGGDLICNPPSAGMAFLFNSSFVEPGRKGFIRIMNHNGFNTAFDMSTPKQLESGSHSGLIVFIIFVMISFGLVTSNSITVIALHPLERMLSVVRQRCKQIFQYTDELEESDSDEDGDKDENYDDNEHSSEFALLERVVAKLAAIAHLSNTKDEVVERENMTEEDKTRLNWMQGAPSGIQKRRPSRGAKLPAEGEDEVRAEAVQRDVPISISIIPVDVIDALQTSAFMTLDLPKDLTSPVGVHILLTSEGSRTWLRQNVQETHIVKFVTTCESKYKANPFHNFAHALDVEYVVSRNMRLIEADRFLPETSQFWLLVAAVGHDLGHLGVNNQYLIETSHELAVQYNDRSPLEMMHCSSLFHVVSDPQANVFAGCDKDLYKEMRKGIIFAILHTDVVKHNDMMKELVLLYQMNSEAFDAQKDPEQSTARHTQELVEVLQSNLQLTLNLLLHGADVGNPMKPWHLAQRLAHLCVDEFFAQGDLEKAAGLPVQMLNDRDKVNRPNSQIGFIEFVIAPMVDSMVHLFPSLDDLADNLGTNVRHWLDCWVEEAKPAAEVRSKTEARVMKVYNKCQSVLRAPAGEDMVFKLSVRE